MGKRTLSVASYGIYVVCMSSLKRFLTSKQIKSKNLLRVFQDDHELYIESLKKGIWIPIVPINSIDYEILIGQDEIIKDHWEEVFTYNGFNLNVEDSNIWIGSLGSLANFKPSQFKNPALDSLSYQTLDGQTLYKGFKIRLEKGKYRVAISGYKKGVIPDKTIYGYGFNFELTDEFTSYNDPREDELYTFNMMP